MIPTGDVNPQGTLRIYLRSVDGAAWSPVELPFSTPPFFVCQNNRFVGIHTYDGVWFSDNATTFTRSYTPPANTSIEPVGVAFGNDIWIIALSDGSILRSTSNAASWTRRSTPSSLNSAIAYGGGNFVINAPPASLVSPDGLTWVIGEAIPGGDLCYGNGHFETTEVTSTDGLSWAERTVPLPENCDSLRFGAGTFLTWTNDNPPKAFTLVSNSWKGPFPMAVIDYVTDVSFCGDRWLGVTYTDKVVSSPVPALAPPVAPPLTVSPALRLTWPGEAVRSYVIQRSIDQTTWTDYSGIISGTSTTMEWIVPATATREFFRVQVR